MTMTRIEKLKALSELHDDWFEENEAAASKHFNPDGYPAEKSDYNQHNVDLDADAAAQDDFARRANEIFGVQGSLIARTWNEGDHPRDPGGEDGGKFIEKGTVGIDEGVAKKLTQDDGDGGGTSDDPGDVPLGEAPEKPSLQRYSKKAAELNASYKGGLKDETHLGDSSATVYRITMNDGTEGIWKNYQGKSAEAKNSREIIASKVAATLGIDAPTVIRTDDGNLLQDLREGKPGNFASASPALRGKLNYDSDQAVRIALLDQLIDNTDRSDQNYLVDKDGNFVAIDHGNSFDFVMGSKTPALMGSEFSQHFAHRDENGREVWNDSNALTADDIAYARGQLSGLKAEFDDAGQSEAFNNMMKRLDAIGSRASGDRNILGVDDESRQPLNTNEDVVESPDPPGFAATSYSTVSEGDFAGLKKVGEQQGFNPAGIYEAGDGSRYYIKQHRSEENAKNEAVANALYQKLGVDVPQVHVGKGASGLRGPQLASEWRELSSADYDDPAVRKEIQRDFAVDAWLANWDVAGAGGTNNVELDRNGFAVRVEAGGALLTSGTGAPKGARFTDYVGEFDTMRDASLNPSSAKVFGDINDERLVESMERLAVIKPATIKQIVKDGSMPDSLAEKLIKRREDILRRAEELRLDLEARNAPRVAGEPLRERTALAATPLRLPMHDDEIGAAYDTEAILFNRTGRGLDDVSPEGVAEWSRILRGYRGGTFHPIGAYMRDPDNNPDTFAPRRAMGWPSGERIDVHVAYMTSAFEHSQLDEDIETFRGIFEPEKVFGNSWLPDGDMTGTKWVERGPTSTSPNIGSALVFGSLMMRIRVPKGTGAIQLSDWPIKYAGSKREAEIALQPYLRYRIVGDSVKEVDGMRILDIEVEPLGDDEEE